MRPTLIAGGGEMTVGRRTSTYVYGVFQVDIPEGKEQAQQNDRLQEGYVYRPDQRPTGRFDIGFVRADARVDLNAQQSNLESIIDAAQNRVEGAVFFERDITGRGLGRFCPGIDFTGWDGLVSLVSVEGGVKEACLYSPALTDGLHREAVIIRDGTMDILTDRDDPGADTPVGQPGTYIIDPDGAVIRAGLVRHYAHRENLWFLDERIAYLTGDRIPAGMSGFPYIEMVPLKKLRSVLRDHDCGSVEILVRGVDVDPDRLRQKLRLAGSRPMAVVCTRIGRSGVALVCEARVVGEPPAGQPIP